MDHRFTVSAVIPHKDTYLYVCNEKGRKWSFPSGKVNPQETLEDALKRETQEETSVEIDIPFLIGIYRFKSDNGNDVLNFVYLATIKKGEPRAGKGIKEVAYVSLEEAQELVQKGKMRAGYANIQPIIDYKRGQRFPLEMVHQL